jgi:hypothetical protein
MKVQLGIISPPGDELKEGLDIAMIVIFSFTLLATIIGIKRFVIDQPKNRTLMVKTFYILTIAVIAARISQYSLDLCDNVDNGDDDVALVMNIVAIGLAALIGLSQAIWMHEIKKKIET